MFHIPAYNQMEMTFDKAKDIIASRANGNLLRGMEDMRDLWDRHAAGNSPYETDADFIDDWEYEANAYNVVFKTFGPLFGAKV